MAARLFFFFIALLWVQVNVGQVKRVLFIGNSYTYYNDLPVMFKDMALSAGDTFIVDMSAPGGFTFEDHCTYSQTLTMMQQEWDFVVLQEQSQKPSFPPAQVSVEVYPYARKLDSLIHESNPCAQTVFFMTWGRKYGDTQNCPYYPPLCTFEGMNERLRESYLEMGDMNEALVVPVGSAWKLSREQDSTLNLWSTDNSHPSIYGSYLSACVFYAMITGKSPIGLTYTSSLTQGEAAYFQQIASQTVFDSLEVWNVGVFQPIAHFSWADSGTGIQFFDESLNATWYNWHFGDGYVDTIESPEHTYQSPGQYVVEYIVGNECFSDTITDTVNVITVGLETNKRVFEIDVYPVPFSDELQIIFPSWIKGLGRIKLTSAYGQVEWKEAVFIDSFSEEIQINTSGLSVGLYFLEIETEKGIFVKKIVKT